MIHFESKKIKIFSFIIVLIGVGFIFSIYKIKTYDPHLKIMKVIEKEKNEKPKNILNDQIVKFSQVDENLNLKSEQLLIDQKTNLINKFSETKYSEPQILFEQVESLSKDILKTNISQKNKAELNKKLHQIISLKMSEFKVSKVNSTEFDEQNNLIRPIFESVE